ncbi:hypothetical protein SCLCIDRAFT_1216517 [Scleroderma citrinum Foug A]|uniref:Uncharacterized protein n=1 Tax=Scleroderma citrinum Foug A TaxID=1036808 RepID=A0A0C3DXA4_9AGAM|nr:hypothetical protein SCLCIDRAFT_1216517 [Scleroderma citrinum Foug A]
MQVSTVVEVGPHRTNAESIYTHPSEKDSPCSLSKSSTYVAAPRPIHSRIGQEIYSPVRRTNTREIGSQRGNHNAHNDVSIIYSAQYATPSISD